MTKHRPNLERFRDVHSVVSLAHALGIKANWIAEALSATYPYRVFSLPKKSGGHRTIEIPAAALMLVQRSLNRVLAQAYMAHLPAAVHGFVPTQKGSNKNHITHAALHVGAHQVLTIDLKDFFHAFNGDQIRAALCASHVGMQHLEGASLVTLLLMYQFRLPMGSPASPIMSNICFYQMDLALEKWAKEKNLLYSRYADDLSFSAHHPIAPDTIKEVKEILFAAGFDINEKKLRLQGKFRAQYVTGVKVNAKTNLPRAYLRSIRAMVHHAEQTSLSTAALFFCRKKKRSALDLPAAEQFFIQHLKGKLGYLLSVCPGSVAGLALKERLKLLVQAQ